MTRPATAAAWGQLSAADVRLARTLAKRRIGLEVETPLGQVWLDAQVHRVQVAIGASGRPGLELLAEALPADAGDVPRGPLRYRLAEPLLAGAPVEEQLRFLAQQVQQGERAAVREAAARRCGGCGHHVTETFCGHCGERAHLPRPILCSPRAHALWAGEAPYCPFCGDALTTPTRTGTRFQTL